MTMKNNAQQWTSLRLGVGLIAISESMNQLHTTGAITMWYVLVRNSKKRWSLESKAHPHQLEGRLLVCLAPPFLNNSYECTVLEERLCSPAFYRKPRERTGNTSFYKASSENENESSANSDTRMYG
jgi:hypothetical protein